MMQLPAFRISGLLRPSSSDAIATTGVRPEVAQYFTPIFGGRNPRERLTRLLRTLAGKRPQPSQLAGSLGRIFDDLAH
jgi:hypothetical protein